MTIPTTQAILGEAGSRHQNRSFPDYFRVICIGITHYAIEDFSITYHYGNGIRWDMQFVEG